MSQPIEQLKNRLKKALLLRGVKPIELSEKTGIPKSAISQYTSGYAKPKQDRIYLICKALDINEAWLMGYDVPMEKGSKNEVSPRIMQYFEKLNDLGKKEATKRVEELTYLPQYTSTTILNAAHAYENASEDDKIHDEDIMNDDKLWNNI